MVTRFTLTSTSVIVDVSNILKQEDIIYLGCSANQEIIIIIIKSKFCNYQKNFGAATSTKSKNIKSYNLYLEIDNTLEIFQLSVYEAMTQLNY
ncbi:MAG: hypothetical protein AAGE84_16170 [Cyanobacteria bacterium P01_G01_bin.39]